MVQLADLGSLLAKTKFVDLTYTFDENTPHFSALPAERRQAVFHYEPGQGSLGTGFLVHEYCHVGQWGTHVDPPVHFIKGAKTLDQIPVSEMILPLVVLNIEGKFQKDYNAEATLEDLEKWESQHGTIPDGAFVALHTGWGKAYSHVPELDNLACHPGWGAELLHVLAHKRTVTAIGHDVLDTDGGRNISNNLFTNEDFWLRQGKWQIEFMTNLDEVPPAGAWIVATWPKPRNGSGFPARCFALVPQ